MDRYGITMYSARSERNPREFPITDQGRADQGVFENSFPPSARPTKLSLIHIWTLEQGRDSGSVLSGGLSVSRQILDKYRGSLVIKSSRYGGTAGILSLKLYGN